MYVKIHKYENIKLRSNTLLLSPYSWLALGQNSSISLILIYAWGLSPSKYVNQAVKNCQTHLTQKLNDKYKIPTRAENPFATGYCPDTDVTEPLDDECSSFFQHLIGVMRWMVELGRVDIAVEVSLLSSYLAYPREGHLEAAIHRIGLSPT